MGYDRDDYRSRGNDGRGGYGNEYGRREERYDDKGYAYGGQRDFQRQGGSDERGFFDRAGDEVRSWFGNDDAERRRERDDRDNYGAQGARGGYGERSRQDYSRGYARDVERSRGEHEDGFFDRVGRWFEGEAPRGGGSAARDDDHNDYHGWRTRQIADLDRDYHEYRQENRKRFEDEFGEFRNRRQTQRASLNQVKEHFEVLGSDGEHVGKVDKVRGDRIILAKNDPAAGGHHHSIPSNWLQGVDGERVTITKTAAEAKQAWTDLDTNSAMFGDSDDNRSQGAHVLNRSFSGTY